MIVKMKKTTLLCLQQDREKALEKLRELGLMHVESVAQTSSEDKTKLEQQASKLERAIAVLASHKPKQQPEGEALSPEEACQKTLEAIDQESDIKKELDHLLREQERLSHWGEFDFALIDKLKEKGVNAYLCAASEEKLKAVPEDVLCEVIKEEKGEFYFVVISDRELEDDEVPPLANVPKNKSLSDIAVDIEECRKRVEEHEKVIDSLTLSLNNLLSLQQETEEGIEFYSNRDGMGAEGEIAYLQGYVPVTEVDKLKDAAKEHGWAVQLLDPSDDDNVPTYITTPKIFEVSKPIFDFIGIAPGYKEWDVSVCFLIFFTLFFGMIVGDAGYGSIFLVLAVICKFVFKSPKAKLPINLFILLSLATIIWGGLTCTWFGIPSEKLPSFIPKGVKELTDPAVKDKWVQWLCFLIAAIHLSLARIWKAGLLIRNVKDALGQLGWACLLWGNFFLAVDLIVDNGSFPEFAKYIYIAGGILILTCYVNWKDVADIFNLFSAVIGSFVDLLSYIRLFAVGLSTYYIASSFNSMGKMVFDIDLPSAFFPLLVIGGIIVILFGHALNIALAIMGVLVHGIRLNTLEFSNHMEIQWLGRIFSPFKKIIEDKKEK